jgi:PEGA domain
MFTQTVCELKQFKRKSLFFYASLCLWACVGLMSSCAVLAVGRFSKATVIKDEGKIVITSIPEDATVLLNDRIIGKTPMSLPISTEASSENYSLPDNANKTIRIVKSGYADQTFIATPSKTVGRNRKGTIFWLGVAQTVTGVALATSSKSGTSSANSMGWLLGLSGIVDIAWCIDRGDRESPLKTVTHTYENNIHANLISVEEDARQKRAVAERQLQEYAERQRLEQEKRQRQEEYREIARKATLQRFSEMQLREGDKICAQATNCTSVGYFKTCSTVSAFVEKWSSDRIRYQIRIHSVNSGDGTTYSDPSGRVYTEIAGNRYHVGEIIWINPSETPNITWYRCQ